MTYPDRADWSMVEALLERKGTRVPDYADEAIARAVTGRQRAAWTFPARWIPSGVLNPAGRWVVLMAILALVLLGMLLLWAGAPPTPVPGLAGNGLIAVTLDLPGGAGGYDTVLVDPSTGSVAPGTPTWPGAAFGFSPDGSRLLYLVPGPGDEVSATAIGGSLWAGDVDGTSTTRLTGQLGQVTEASWSPDGRRVVVAFLDETHRTRIGVAETDGSGMRVLELGGPADTPSWDPTGRRILFRGFRETHRALYTVAVDDPGDIRGVVGLDDAASDSGIEPEAAWSPDGQRIAYVRLVPGEGSRTALHVVAVDGSEDRVLPVTSHSSQEMRPQWSADGRLIVARAWPRLTVVEVEHGIARPVGPEPVDSTFGLRHFAWSPDGRSVVAGPHYTLRPEGDAIGYDDPRLVVINATTGTWTDAGYGIELPMFGPSRAIAWQPVTK